VDDDLADVPPEAFVAARDALVAQLKAEGKPDEVADVKKRRKPTVVQWLTEQVRRRHADKVDALRAALREMVVAQEAVLTGGGRHALQDATAKRRTAVDALRRAVDDVIATSGRPAHHRDEVLGAVESAVTAEVSTGTLGVRDDLELPDLPAPKPARDLVAERRAAAAQAAIEAAEARVRRARDELARAEAELDAVQQKYAE
jgi:hypothetical protein